MNISDFVADNVHASAYLLIDHLYQISSPEVEDVLFVKYDYQEAVEDVVKNANNEQLTEWAEMLECDATPESILDAIDGSAQEFAEDVGIDPYESEALCFYIVSGKLAYYLKKHGEMVEDILGLNIWGRTTYGQLIEDDYVIKQIFNSIYKKG